MAEEKELETYDWAVKADEGKTYTCNIENPDLCESCSG